MDNSRYQNQPGTAERVVPAIQTNAQTNAAEASAINDRLEALLDRLRTPGPRGVDPNGGRINDGPAPIPTLQSVVAATGKIQHRTHELLTELESLV